MTTYGTIPSSSSPSPDLDSILRAKERIKAGLLNHRPWKIMFNCRSCGIPHSGGDLLSRLRVNWVYFGSNYLILLNLGLFLFSLCYPISTIAFVVFLACLLYLLFLRDEPLVLLGHSIDDNVVMVVMSVFYVVLIVMVEFYVVLYLIQVGFDVQVLGPLSRWWSILWVLPMLVVMVTVQLHAILRKKDDLSLDEEEAAGLTPHGDFNLRTEQRIKAGLRNYRPWKTMFNFRSFGISPSDSRLSSRVQFNFMYFGINYMILLSLGLFLIFLQDTLYMIQFFVIIACWFYLRFIRDEPLVILGHPINDRDMLVVMLVYNVVLLWLLDFVWSSPLAILFWILILGTVQMHAMFRKTDDLSLEEEDAAAELGPAGDCILSLFTLLAFITSGVLFLCKLYFVVYMYNLPIPPQSFNK